MSQTLSNETNWGDLPPELKCVIFGQLSDRYGLLRLINDESKQLIDLFLASDQVQSQTSVSIAFESESLVQYVSSKVTLTETDACKAIEKGRTTNIKTLNHFGHPTVNLIKSATKVDRFDIVNEVMNYFESNLAWTANCLRQMILTKIEQGITMDCINFLKTKESILDELSCINQKDESIESKIIRIVSQVSGYTYICPRDVETLCFFLQHSAKMSISIILIPYHRRLDQLNLKQQELVQSTLKLFESNLPKFDKDPLDVSFDIKQMDHDWSKFESRMSYLINLLNYSSLMVECLALLFIALSINDPCFASANDLLLEYFCPLIQTNASLLKALIDGLSKNSSSNTSIFSTFATRMRNVTKQSKKTLTYLCIQNRWIEGLMVLQDLNLIHLVKQSSIEYIKMTHDNQTTMKQFYIHWMQNGWFRTVYEVDCMFFNIFDSENFDPDLASQFKKDFPTFDPRADPDHFDRLFDSPIVHWTLSTGRDWIMPYEATFTFETSGALFRQSFAIATLRILDDVLIHFKDFPIKQKDLDSIVENIVLTYDDCDQDLMKSLLKEYVVPNEDCCINFKNPTGPICGSGICNRWWNVIKQRCLTLIVEDFSSWDLNQKSQKLVYDYLNDQIEPKKFLKFYQSTTHHSDFLIYHFPRFFAIYYSIHPNAKELPVYFSNMWKKSYLTTQLIDLLVHHKVSTISNERFDDCFDYQRCKDLCLNNRTLIQKFHQINHPSNGQISIIMEATTLIENGLIDQFSLLNQNLDNEIDPFHDAMYQNSIKHLHSIFHHIWSNEIAAYEFCKSTQKRNQIINLIMEVRYGASIKHLEKLVEVGLVSASFVINVCSMFHKNFYSYLHITDDEAHFLDEAEKRRSKDAERLCKFIKKYRKDVSKFLNL